MIPTLRADGPDVWYADAELAVVGADAIAFLKQRACESPRMRARICMHANVDAVVHEMVIVHHRSCYVRPHRHLRKAESLSVLEGRASGFVFDDSAPHAVLQKHTLDAANGAAIWRVPANTWHGLVIASEWLVFYEVSAGPFVPDASEFAPWAPAERDATAGTYLEGLRAHV